MSSYKPTKKKKLEGVSRLVCASHRSSHSEWALQSKFWPLDGRNSPAVPTISRKVLSHSRLPAGVDASWCDPPFSTANSCFFLPPAQADRHNSAGCGFFLSADHRNTLERIWDNGGLGDKKTFPPDFSKHSSLSPVCPHAVFFFFFSVSLQVHKHTQTRSCATAALFSSDWTQTLAHKSQFFCRAGLGCVCVCGVAGGGDAEKPRGGKHEFECFRFALVFHSVPLGAQIASSRHSGFLFFPFFPPLLL